MQLIPAGRALSSADPRVLFLGVALLSFVLVGAVRRIAVRHGVIDHPTDRGSHTVATPRGGGLGAMVAILLVLASQAAASGELALWGCVVAGAAVATVGWFDDHRGMGVRVRLLVHVLAGVAVAVLAHDAGAGAVGVALAAWWVFWTVSSINVVNFMDGINGLVASQIAIFAASLAFFGGDVGVVCAAALAAACVGFLPWNFPRARIFLGDVGSGGLGFLVPVAALLTMRATGIDVVRAHLPLLPLFGDATVTMARRWRAGERLTVPHRTHLYQRLANGGMGHTRVTLLFAAAAAVGGGVAHLPPGVALVVGVALYASVVGGVGLLLHRRCEMGRVR